jgi:hypothetical protein
MAVGGSLSGCADDNCCSAIAIATPTTAAWVRVSHLPVGAPCGDDKGLGVREPASSESDADALSGDEVSLSAVRAVSKVIINQRIRMAMKTSPMPKAVI